MPTIYIKLKKINKKTVTLNEMLINSNVNDFVKPLLSNKFKLYKECTISNTIYEVSNVISYKLNLIAEFYQIHYIAVEAEEVYFICKNIIKKGYDNHIKCFIVELDSNETFIKINITNLDSLPCRIFKYSVDNNLYNKDYYVIVDCNF